MMIYHFEECISSRQTFISNAFTVDFLINFESSEYEVMLYEQ